MVYHGILNVVLCLNSLNSRTLLFIHYMYENLHLLTPPSHSLPPSTPPPWHPAVYSLCPYHALSATLCPCPLASRFRHGLCEVTTQPSCCPGRLPGARGRLWLLLPSNKREKREGQGLWCCAVPRASLAEFHRAMRLHLQEAPLTHHPHEMYMVGWSLGGQWVKALCVLEAQLPCGEKKKCVCVCVSRASILTLQHYRSLKSHSAGLGSACMQIWEELHCVELQLQDVGNQKTIRVKDRCSES